VRAAAGRRAVGERRVPARATRWVDRAVFMALMWTWKWSWGSVDGNEWKRRGNAWSRQLVPAN
jgi:hypothetical protein